MVPSRTGQREQERVRFVAGLSFSMRVCLQNLTAAGLLLLGIAACGPSACAQDSQVAPVPPAPALTIPRLRSTPALEDFLGMKPHGETALQMAKVTGFTQRNP